MTALPFEKAEHNHPDFRPGDTVRVHVRVVEGESERIQVFEGVVISRRGGGRSESFTVRKVSFGVGVERTFPINSPRIQRIELSRSGRVRRSKLFYLRDLTGRAARLGEGVQEGSVQAPAEAKAQTPASSPQDSSPKAEAAAKGSPSSERGGAPLAQRAAPAA